MQLTLSNFQTTVYGQTEAAVLAARVKKQRHRSACEQQSNPGYVTVKQWICILESEQLHVRFGPKYQESQIASFFGVYVLPSAAVKTLPVVARLQKQDK